MHALQGRTSGLWDNLPGETGKILYFTFVAKKSTKQNAVPTFVFL